MNSLKDDYAKLVKDFDCPSAMLNFLHRAYTGSQRANRVHLRTTLSNYKMKSEQSMTSMVHDISSMIDEIYCGKYFPLNRKMKKIHLLSQQCLTTILGPLWNQLGIWFRNWFRKLESQTAKFWEKGTHDLLLRKRKNKHWTPRPTRNPERPHQSANATTASLPNIGLDTNHVQSAMKISSISQKKRWTSRLNRK